jgi:hypothetical protein
MRRLLEPLAYALAAESIALAVAVLIALAFGA